MTDSNSWVSKEKVAKEINVSPSTVYNNLNKLYEFGWLKKAGFQNSVAKLEPTKKAIKHFFE
jgi:Fe2+ or Zn2+ uptake regulation protein